MEQTVIPCPFCGGHNIGYSVKTMGIRAKKYHVAMYCKDCNCYGKRTIVSIDTDSEYTFREDIEKNATFKQLAIDAWNTRLPMENIIYKISAQINATAEIRKEALQKNQVDIYEGCGERLAEANLCRAIVEEENRQWQI